MEGGGPVQIKIFKNNNFKLSTKQMRAIELLISCEMSQTKVAEEVDVSERTLYNWMRCNEEFRSAMEWYRKEVYKDYAPKAVETVVEIMLNGENDRVRLDAAKDILTRAGDDAVSKVDLESENTVNINVRTMEKDE